VCCATLPLGAMHHHRQDQPQGIDRQMSFAAGDLFAGIVATHSADFRRFYALAVENRGAGLGLVPRCASDSLAAFVVNLLPQAPELPLPERKRFRKHTPLVDVTDRAVHNGSHVNQISAVPIIGGFLKCLTHR
jgi:hypothetical protein